MATRSLGQLTIDLIAKTGGFEQGMDRASRSARTKSREIEKEAQRSAQSIQKAWSIAAYSIQGAIAAISIGAAFTAFIRETIAVQNQQAQLSAVLRSTGEVAGYTAEQLNKMAASMQSSTIFSSGEINEAQTTFLAFTGIVGEQFPRALQAAADMAARTGMSIKSAAETIGRALDVPSQGLASLSRQGFRFTEEQKSLVDQLESTGRAAEAQGIILRALEESYGGAAVAARDTLGGALISLGNTFSGMIVGSDAAVRPLIDWINAINDALSSGEARAALDGIALAAKALSIIMVGRLAVSAAMAAASFRIAIPEAIRYQIALAGMAGASTKAATAIGVLSIAGRAAAATLVLLTGPVGAVVAIAATAAVSIYSYRDSTDAAAKSSESLAQKTDWLNASLDGMSRNQAAAAMVDLRREYSALQLRAIDAQSAVQRLTAQLEQYPDNKKAAAWREELIQQKGALDDTTQSVQKLAGQIQVLNGIISSPTGAASLSSDYRKFEASIERQIALIGKTGQAVQLRYDLERGEMSKWSEDERTLASQRVNELELAERAEEARRKAATGTRAQSNELLGLINQLERQRATLGMTAEQAERYRIEIASGTKAQREQALALFDGYQAVKQINAAQEAYLGLVRDLRTPEEQATEQLRERMAVLRQAKISMEEYASTAERISRAAIESAPQYGGLDASIGGAAGELAKVEEAREKLADWYQTQLEMQRSFLDEKEINEEAYASAVAEITRQNNDQLGKIQAAYKTASLSMFSDMTSQTVGMLDVMGREGSAAYKALFLAGKAASIAQAVINTEEAATKALTLGPILGPPAALVARITGYASVATIAAQTIVGMAHDGIDSVPSTGTWLLEKGERVMTAQTSAKLDGVLSQVQAGGSQGVIINQIEDRDRAGAMETMTGPDGEQIINIFVADIRGGGRASQALEATYGMRRRGS